eukprot:109970_1
MCCLSISRHLINRQRRRQHRLQTNWSDASHATKMCIFYMALISVLFDLPHICSSETIHTNSSGQYHNKSVRCDSSKNCTVICDESNSCQEADIYCPDNFQCNIQCIGTAYPAATAVCEHATFHCPDNAQCDIECISPLPEMDIPLEVCSNAKFYWPITAPYDTAYTLTCSGQSACSHTIIDIPQSANKRPIFQCSGRYGCQSTTINCPDDSDCTIICGSNTDSKSCQNAEINGPINGTLHVQCVGQYNSCFGAKINCSESTSCTVDCLQKSQNDWDKTCLRTKVIWSTNGDNNAICKDRYWNVMECPDAMINIPSTNVSCSKAEINTMGYSTEGGAEYIVKDQGRINGVNSWDIMNSSHWNGDAIFNFSFSSDLAINSDVYGSGNSIDSELCKPFKLDDDDYINAYRVIYSIWSGFPTIYGLFFYTAKDDVYKCCRSWMLDNRGNNGDSGIIQYKDHYLSGFTIHSADILNSISFQFKPLSDCHGNSLLSTTSPSSLPTASPTSNPSWSPTSHPSLSPATSTMTPSWSPTVTPSMMPSLSPTSNTLQTLLSSAQMTVSGCSSKEFLCKNNNCISIDLQCDDINDCGDNSDEYGCVLTTAGPKHTVNTSNDPNIYMYIAIAAILLILCVVSIAMFVFIRNKRVEHAVSKYEEMITVTATV